MRGNSINLSRKRVLEATEMLLKYGAIVRSFDYSNAVEVNAKNNGHYDNLILVQADIRKIPFVKLNYDYVFCLGVLQHTPSLEESIKCLWEMVKPGGTLIIDNYLWKWQFILPPPFDGAESVYRKVALRLPRNKRFSFVKSLTDFWFPYRRSNQISKLLEDIDTKDIIVEIGGNGIEAFCKKRIVLNSTASLATETLLQKQL